MIHVYVQGRVSYFKYSADLNLCIAPNTDLASDLQDPLLQVLAQMNQMAS